MARKGGKMSPICLIGVEKTALPKELFPLLEKYNFPGNISELKKMVYDAVSRCESGFLSLDALLEAMDGIKKDCE